MKHTLTRTFATGCLLLAAAQLSAAEVYTWRDQKGRTTYSDVPNRLQPARSNLLNVRTHSVSQPVQPQTAAQPDSIYEQQRQLNDKIAQANQQIDEQNKKIEEANRQTNEDNCNAARLNRQFAETARSANRDALIQRYEADIGKYCN